MDLAVDETNYLAPTGYPVHPQCRFLSRIPLQVGFNFSSCSRSSRMTPASVAYVKKSGNKAGHALH